MFANGEALGESSFLYKKAVSDISAKVLNELAGICEISPFRKMTTRRGLMPVEMTNCGDVGWLTDKKGYRYTKTDPLTGRPWAPMPEWLKTTAIQAARAGGFLFTPNICLINRYYKGTKLGLHIDRDEGDFTQPIVSFSFGAPAVFKWGRLSKTDKAENIILEDGDVLVWGGEDRLRYHAITKIGDKTSNYENIPRYCLTFRYAKIWQKV